MASSVPARDVFGETSDGHEVDRFTLKNDNNMKVEILTLGGIISSMEVPDGRGKIDDVVNGFDNVADYETKSKFFGCLVGRVANRICKGRFTLDGEEYQLTCNNGPNALHGGPAGFDKAIWEAEVVGRKLQLRHTSPDGHEHYPGEVRVCVSYELTKDNQLIIDYTATTSKATPINLTNHSYFNLAGHKAESVADHTVTIFAEKFTPVDDTSIPTGEIATVSGTLFDLRTPTLLGDRIPHIVGAEPGYDHNYCFGKRGEMKLVARVEHGDSGREMEVHTTQPGLQFYTGNYLCNIPGKDGATYKQHSGLCLETQNYPDAINQKDFPCAVLRPGETYNHTTIYKFKTK